MLQPATLMCDALGLEMPGLRRDAQTSRGNAPPTTKGGEGGWEAAQISEGSLRQQESVARDDIDETTVCISSCIRGISNRPDEGEENPIAGGLGVVGTVQPHLGVV